MIPFSAGAQWGCEGSFTPYELDAAHHVAYQENQASGVFIEGKAADICQKVLENLLP